MWSSWTKAAHSLRVSRAANLLYQEKAVRGRYRPATVGLLLDPVDRSQDLYMSHRLATVAAPFPSCHRITTERAGLDQPPSFGCSVP
jgi:hypothetical protein